MNRRGFLKGSLAGTIPGLGTLLAGCHGKQYANILSPDQQDMVGSHAAGSAVYQPLVSYAVDQLLSKENSNFRLVDTHQRVPQKRICYVGLENRSSEEIGDFKDQIDQMIETAIVDSRTYTTISRRFVEAGLREARVRKSDLIIPNKRRSFLAVMERHSQPFDYLLFARLTSGTTRNNNSQQRDYRLDLELVDIDSGEQERSHAMIPKQYHRSRVRRWLSR